MILQFSVKNYKTFREKATLSLIASNYDKDTREYDNIYADEKYGFRALKSAVVYGANASGKTNLLDAFAFMRYFVMSSAQESHNGENSYLQPFRLNSESEKEPSEFEVIFIVNDTLFRYGFEVTTQQVVSEWLFFKPRTKETELFYRDGNDFEIHKTNFSKAKTIVKEGLVRDNALLVSVAAQFNEKTAITIVEWFRNLRIFSSQNEYDFHKFTTNKTENPLYKAKIADFLKAADFGIQNIILQKKNENSEHVPYVLTTHKKYDSDKKSVGLVNFSLESEESSGTIKFFALAGTILDVLENGFILIADELDAKLHSNLVCKILLLFNSKEFNPKNAQLIFNTHDTHLLSLELFRRDQIWFANKDKYGEAKLYSLDDFKSDEVRRSDPFEDNYLKGKYGAIPFLGFFDNLNYTLSQHENEK